MGIFGTGKTTMMKYLAQMCPLNYWVVFVLFDEMNSILNYVDSEPIVDRLLNQTKANNADNAIMQLYRKEKKIIFFFDGINIINDNFRQKAIMIIQTISQEGYKIWISCRNNLKYFIERYLGMSILYYQVDVFTEKDQEEFIGKKIKNSKAKKIFEKIVKDDSIQSYAILKQPLILNLVAENPNNLKDITSSNFGICKIYEVLVDTKLKHVLYKKRIEKDVLEKMNIVIDVFKHFYFKGYQILALQCCLETRIFESLNVQLDEKLLQIMQVNDFLGFVKCNEDNSFSFEHHSFAEYLAAMWLVKNFKLIGNVDKKFIFQTEYNEIRHFFDTKLAENCPLHLAVLNQNLSEVEKFEHLINEKDKGGRTALHLAASLCRKHKFFEKNEMKLSSYHNNEKYIQRPGIIFEYLLTLKCNPFQEDELFKWNVFQYADAAFSLHAVEKLIEKVKNKESWTYLETLSDNLHAVTFYCVCLGYKNLLELAIKFKGLEELSRLHDKEPLLHLALENNQREIAELLINSDFDLTKTDVQNNTALHKAATWGHKEFVILLLEKKVDIEPRNKMGKTPLHLASRMGHENIIRILLKNGAHPDAVDREGKTAMHTAAFLGRVNIIEILHEFSSNLNGKTNEGKTPLHRAAIMGHLGTVKYLIKHGANIEDLDKFKFTALHFAALEGRLEIVEYLIHQKADVFAKNEKNETAKQLAINGNHMKIVEILQKVEKKNLVQVKKDDKNLHEGAEEGDLEFIVKEYNKATDKLEEILEQRNKELDTLLHISARRGHLKLVQFLLSKNVSTRTQNIDGRTALHVAAYYGHIEIVKQLIPRSEISAVDKWDRSALHRAVFNGKLEVAKTLIDAGADINCCSKDGTTVLHAAVRGGYLELMKWLLENGANVNLRTDTGKTCLHIAVARRFPTIVKYLVEKEKHIVNYIDGCGKTALYVAAQKGYKDILDILIAGGADINQTNDYRETALDAARDADREEIVEYFKKLNVT